MENIQKKERILAIDALRGFAVMGIILLHNIEHFNFYSFPETSSPVLDALDKSLWDMLFFIFSGKAYAIFALLFGFTFYLQSRGSEKRGEDFKNRYMWRLLLLLGFGFVNSLFFPGEILVLYRFYPCACTSLEQQGIADTGTDIDAAARRMGESAVWFCQS